ncbi:hypothetical protein SRHO_G00158800 [Serrasalmus rhombeus]
MATGTRTVTLTRKGTERSTETGTGTQMVIGHCEAGIGDGHWEASTGARQGACQALEASTKSALGAGTGATQGTSTGGAWRTGTRALCRAETRVTWGAEMGNTETTGSSGDTEATGRSGGTEARGMSLGTEAGWSGDAALRAGLMAGWATPMSSVANGPAATLSVAGRSAAMSTEAGGPAAMSTVAGGPAGSIEVSGGVAPQESYYLGGRRQFTGALQSTLRHSETVLGRLHFLEHWVELRGQGEL